MSWVNLFRVMSTLKLKINVNLPQLLYFVVSAAQNCEFERFGFALTGKVREIWGW